MNGVPALGIHPFGVIGSAIGAATGWVLGCLLAFDFLTRQHPRAPRLVWSALRPNRSVAARVLNIGLPSGAELAVFQMGVLTFYRVVVGLGPAAYAANITINTVESLGSLPGFGFAVAATALVGQALGAGDPTWRYAPHGPRCDPASPSWAAWAAGPACATPIAWHFCG